LRTRQLAAYPTAIAAFGAAIQVEAHSMTRTACLCAVSAILGASPLAAQTIVGSNFAGSTFLVDSSFRQPDTMGAAGVDHYVELINGRFSVYRKSDGVRVQTSTLNQFWNNAGQTPSGINGAFDPRVVFDPHAHRWYAVAVDNGTNANSYLFAVSSSSDPTQPWTAFKIDSDTDDSNWADFPMIGYNPEAVFLSANMPPLTAPETRMSFVVMAKANLLQPVPSLAGMTLLEDEPRPFGTNALSPQLLVDASNLIGLNTSMPIVMHDFGAGTLYRGEIVSPGSPSIAHVGAIGVPAAANPPTVDQPGPKQNLEANDGRLSASSVLHNGEIFSVHSIDNGGLASVRYLRIDAATNTVLESQTIIDPVGRAHTFPSVAVNDFGDVVIGVTGTSTAEFASSYAMVGKLAGGITTFASPILLKAGVSDYVNLDALNRNRWGDYSSTTVDPADPGIFWTNQEFVSATDVWSTQVTELIVLQPNEARWADAAGGQFDDPTRWLTTHGGAPLNSDHLVFSRATDLSGVSTTVTLPPQPPGVYVYQTLSVRQGDVYLDLAGSQLDLALHVEVGPYYGQPRLTIANGVLNSVVGIVAPRPTSEGELVLDNTHWTVDGVVVGSLPTPSAGCCLPGATGGVGTLAITNNSQVNVMNTLTIHGHAAVNLASGTLAADTIRQLAPPLVGGSGPGLNVTGGELHVNRFDGFLINSGGTLTPGGNGAAGTTDVNFAYLQVAGSVLDIDIGGTGPGQFDQLIVGGQADFDGSLDVATVAGFAPALADTFQFVQAGSIPLTSPANLLANSTFPTITNKLKWQLFYQPTALTLAVVPALSGDFNGNGIVDGADYVMWRNQEGQMGIGLSADGNFDHQVNFVDLAIWRSQFGQFVPGSGAGADLPEGGAVPEPTAGILVFCTVLIATLRRGRNGTVKLGSTLGPAGNGCAVQIL
jgi:hypothetical protein